LIWQFPTALFTLNLVGFNYFSAKPILLFVMAVINFNLIYALWRHIQNSKAIISSTKLIEHKLKEVFDKAISEFEIHRPKATSVILITLLISNLALLVYTFNAAILCSS
jgi:uncharacterized membrane protein